MTVCRVCPVTSEEFNTERVRFTPINEEEVRDYYDNRRECLGGVRRRITGKPQVCKLFRKGKG
ncbi:hypothetical protein JCM10550A_04370 [Methanogenium cariaci]